MSYSLVKVNIPTVTLCKASLELMYVAVTDGHHYVGGTEKGCQFLKECGTYVPYSFVGYLSSGKVNTG